MDCGLCITGLVGDGMIQEGEPGAVVFDDDPHVTSVTVIVLTLHTLNDTLDTAVPQC